VCAAPSRPHYLYVVLCCIEMSVRLLLLLHLASDCAPHSTAEQKGTTERSLLYLHPSIRNGVVLPCYGRECTARPATGEGCGLVTLDTPSRDVTTMRCAGHNATWP
jgi:hypothetical protein